MVIVNPSSGPGSGSAPNEQYQTAITQLSTYPNVQKVGYVRTGYGDRGVDTILEEVDTYAGWRSVSTDLAMQGIFFDEAPYQYSEAQADLLTQINAHVKNVSGIEGPRTVCPCSIQV